MGRTRLTLGALALGALWIAACGARTDLGGGLLSDCPPGERLCETCEGSYACLAGACPSVPCTTHAEERFDSGCHEGELGCPQCDGGTFCAYMCPILTCEDATPDDLDAATLDAACASGEVVCPVGCSDASECIIGDACPGPPPCAIAPH